MSDKAAIHSSFLLLQVSGVNFLSRDFWPFCFPLMHSMHNAERVSFSPILQTLHLIDCKVEMRRRDKHTSQSESIARSFAWSNFSPLVSVSLGIVQQMCRGIDDFYDLISNYSDLTLWPSSLRNRCYCDAKEVTEAELKEVTKAELQDDGSGSSKTNSF